MNVLAVDPGTSNLAFAYLKSEENEIVEVPWVCHVNLSSDHDDEDDEDNNDDDNDDENDEIKRYAKLSHQMENLDSFLKTNENVKSLCDIKDLWVLFEQQEGATDANVLFSLMRVNFVVGFVCGYFKNKGKKIRFLPKNYKWGWSFLTTLAKEKTKSEVSESPGSVKYIRAYKNNRKKAVCAIAREILSSSSTGIVKLDAVKEFSENCCDGTFNHIADAMLQAVKFIKETSFKKVAQNEGKKYKDVLSGGIKKRTRSRYL